jgi:hypothetical protein
MPALLDNTISSTFRIRDVSNSFALARAEENPFSSMAPRGPKPKSSLYEFPFKQRHTATDNAIADGVDVANGEVINNEANKHMLQGRVQKSRVVVGVSDMAEELGEEYAVSGGLLADNVADGLVLARENLEVTLLKNNDSLPYVDADNPMRMRGLAHWIRNTAQAELPVPSAARTPTGNLSLNKAANASDVTEDNVRTIMQSIASTARRTGNWDVFVSPTLKAIISGWARTGEASASIAPLRRFNANQKDTTMTLNIQVYESDFGKLRLHVHYNLPSGVHALIVDMTQVKLRAVRPPTLKPLEYRGGGHRRIIEYIYGLEVSNPQAHGRITTAAA